MPLGAPKLDYKVLEAWSQLRSQRTDDYEAEDIGKGSEDALLPSTPQRSKEKRSRMSSSARLLRSSLSSSPSSSESSDIFAAPWKFAPVSSTMSSVSSMSDRSEEEEEDGEKDKKRGNDDGNRNGLFSVAHTLAVNLATSRFKQFKYPLVWFSLHLVFTLFLVWWLAWRYTVLLCEHHTEFINSGRIFGKEVHEQGWVPPESITPFVSERRGKDGELYTFITSYGNYEFMVKPNYRLCGTAMPQLRCDCHDEAGSGCDISPELGVGGFLIRDQDYRSAPNSDFVKPNNPCQNIFNDCVLDGFTCDDYSGPKQGCPGLPVGDPVGNRPIEESMNYTAEQWEMVGRCDMREVCNGLTGVQFIRCKTWKEALPMALGLATVIEGSVAVLTVLLVFLCWRFTDDEVEVVSGGGGVRVGGGPHSSSNSNDGDADGIATGEGTKEGTGVSVRKGRGKWSPCSPLTVGEVEKFLEVMLPNAEERHTVLRHASQAARSQNTRDVGPSVPFFQRDGVTPGVRRTCDADAPPADGWGEMRWQNGDVYRGNWQAGKMHGKRGSFFYANGCSYVGAFEEGERHGVGCFTFATRVYHRHAGGAGVVDWKEYSRSFGKPRLATEQERKRRKRRRAAGLHDRYQKFSRLLLALRNQKPRQQRTGLRKGGSGRSGEFTGCRGSERERRRRRRMKVKKTKERSGNIGVSGNGHETGESFAADDIVFDDAGDREMVTEEMVNKAFYEFAIYERREVEVRRMNTQHQRRQQQLLQHPKVYTKATVAEAKERRQNQRQRPHRQLSDKATAKVRTAVGAEGAELWRGSEVGVRDGGDLEMGQASGETVHCYDLVPWHRRSSQPQTHPQKHQEVFDGNGSSNSSVSSSDNSIKPANNGNFSLYGDDGGDDKAVSDHGSLVPALVPPEKQKYGERQLDRQQQQQLREEKRDGEEYANLKQEHFRARRTIQQQQEQPSQEKKMPRNSTFCGRTSSGSDSSRNSNDTDWVALTWGDDGVGGWFEGTWDWTKGCPWPGSPASMQFATATTAEASSASSVKTTKGARSATFQCDHRKEKKEVRGGGGINSSSSSDGDHGSTDDGHSDGYGPDNDYEECDRDFEASELKLKDSRCRSAKTRREKNHCAHDRLAGSSDISGGNNKNERFVVGGGGCSSDTDADDNVHSSSHNQNYSAQAKEWYCGEWLGVGRNEDCVMYPVEGVVIWIARYHGEFKHNEEDGLGAYTWRESLDEWDGEWKNGRITGRGVFTRKLDGKMFFENKWEAAKKKHERIGVVVWQGKEFEAGFAWDEDNPRMQFASERDLFFGHESVTCCRLIGTAIVLVLVVAFFVWLLHTLTSLSESQERTRANTDGIEFGLGETPRAGG